jgi:hypothetical protein
MIISASYKTDIPAFYGDWFLNRLNAGYCKITNSYNKTQVKLVSLKPEDVDGFVFWTKNIGPFLSKLKIVHELQYPFMILYTITAYPHLLEASVINSERSIEYMKRLAENYGPNVAVWRYDPILITSATTIDFHRRTFESLARSLQGVTNEVIISFAQIYKKSMKNINSASNSFNFSWEDPVDEIKINLVAELADIAKNYEMRLSICAQDRFLINGAKAASCIDAHRLSLISGRTIKAKLKGKRPDCGCYQSVDIGEYDTCPHGCIYCYAVRNRELAKRRYKRHNPLSEFLYFERSNDTSITPTKTLQMKLI